MLFRCILADSARAATELPAPPPIRRRAQAGGGTPARAILDTNVFGLLDVIRAALPQLCAQRSGTVVNISSMG